MSYLLCETDDHAKQQRHALTDLLSTFEKKRGTLKTEKSSNN